MNSYQVGGSLKSNNMNKISVVLYCTENYLSGSLNVINTLNLYHNDLEFYLYTLNFRYESGIHNVKTIYIEDNRIENNIQFVGTKNDIGNTNVYKAVFFKSRVILDSLVNLKLDNVIYIDSDIIPTGNISHLYGFFSQITDYPLIQNGIFEYQIAFDRGNPFHDGGFDETNILEYPLMMRHYIDFNNRTPYSVASIMLYNKNCKQFIMEYNWLNNLAFDMGRGDIEYFYPFCDETTVNVLLWKYAYNNRLPLMQMNIDKFENVKEFYESNYDEEKELEPFIVVPNKTERKHKLFFHGVKGQLSTDTFDYQKNMFKTKIDFNENKYYITSNVNFNRNLTILFCDKDEVFYDVESFIQQGVEYWYSPSKKLSEVKNLTIKIYDDGKLIFKKTQK